MELIRTEYGEKETIGVIKVRGRILCYSLELPWRDNATDISCIPTGIYMCERFSSKDNPNTFVVLNVPNRTGVLIHTGVTHKHTKGCIIPGTGLSWHNNDRAILSSSNAMKIILNAYKNDDKFLLRISNLREVEENV